MLPKIAKWFYHSDYGTDQKGKIPDHPVYLLKAEAVPK
jgi:hypothetical protein